MGNQWGRSYLAHEYITIKKPMGTIKEPITPSPLNEGEFDHGNAGEI